MVDININDNLNYHELSVRRRSAYKFKYTAFIIPIMAAAFFIFGIFSAQNEANDLYSQNIDEINSVFNQQNIPINSMLASDRRGFALLDTIYTTDSVWLELRIDKQRLTVHRRNDSSTTYLISSGDSTQERSIATRSGLFAIFYKTPLHHSSQYDNLPMYHYEAFNMGIGFHGSAGNEYYNDLGKKPLSHGCIRMKREDAAELFGQTKIGTLVLAHYGESARTIAFAPEGFENEREYTEEDYMKMLAHNLNIIYKGQYFLEPPVRFIIDPTKVPKNGFNLGNKVSIAENQYIPNFGLVHRAINDAITEKSIKVENIGEIQEDIAVNFEGSEMTDDLLLNVSKEHIDNLAFNKRGILPYFPPKN